MKFIQNVKTFLSEKRFALELINDFRWERGGGGEEEEERSGFDCSLQCGFTAISFHYAVLSFFSSRGSTQDSNLDGEQTSDTKEAKLQLVFLGSLPK